MSAIFPLGRLGNVCASVNQQQPCSLIADGGQPKGGLLGGGANSTSGSGMVGGQQRGSNRRFVRRVFNTRSNYQAQGAPSTTSAMLLNGGYRSLMNAGDPLYRYQQQCGGSDQVAGRIRNGANTAARSTAAGSVGSSNCGTTWKFGSLSFTTEADTNPLASGNQRYVVDSSEMTNFRKLKSINQSYNDNSFGGAGGSDMFIALGRVRG
jgi:hypothetical protein